jgi:hypothetical protein
VKKITRELCGHEFTKSVVSALYEKLEAAMDKLKGQADRTLETPETGFQDVMSVLESGDILEPLMSGRNTKKVLIGNRCQRKTPFLASRSEVLVHLRSIRAPAFYFTSSICRARV